MSTWQHHYVCWQSLVPLGRLWRQRCAKHWMLCFCFGWEHGQMEPAFGAAGTTWEVSFGLSSLLLCSWRTAWINCVLWSSSRSKISGLRRTVLRDLWLLAFAESGSKAVWQGYQASVFCFSSPLRILPACPFAWVPQNHWQQHGTTCWNRLSRLHCSLVWPWPTYWQ